MINNQKEVESAQSVALCNGLGIEQWHSPACVYVVHNLHDQKAPEQNTPKHLSLLRYATVYTAC